MLIITKKVKCIPEFEYFTVFLKNRKIISKMKRSKVTDYAALMLIVAVTVSVSRSVTVIQFPVQPQFYFNMLSGLQIFFKIGGPK